MKMTSGMSINFGGGGAANPKPSAYITANIVLSVGLIIS